MPIHVDEQSHLDDLLAFLRKIGCIALRVDGCTLEVHVPETTNERAGEVAPPPDAELKVLVGVERTALTPDGSHSSSGIISGL